MKRILVTGAAGFIGFHLAQRLLARGDSVVGVDNLNAYYDVSLKEGRLGQLRKAQGFRFVRADIADRNAMEEVFGSGRFDAVVNLAAQAGVRYSLQNPRAYVEANVAGFMNILEGARSAGTGHLVYASTSSIYGLNTRMPFDERQNTDHPVSLYAATKKANEAMAHSYAHLFGIPCTGLRFFTVYGPWGRPDMACYAFTKAILEGRTIDVFNHGRMQRDFTYIDDVTEALVRLVELPPRAGADGAASAAPHIIYNIGNHTPIELERFIAAIEAALGCKADKRYLPMQPGDVPATWADVERLTRATGFAPKTTIEDGIARFVAWYRTYHRTA
jgi:UDP-glucuronate 4-epimerase